MAYEVFIWTITNALHFFFFFCFMNIKMNDEFLKMEQEKTQIVYEQLISNC